MTSRLPTSLEAPASVASVNALLAAIGEDVRLRAGRGYVYFSDGDTTVWHETSVAIPAGRLRYTTVEDLVVRALPSLREPWDKKAQVREAARIATAALEVLEARRR